MPMLPFIESAINATQSIAIRSANSIGVTPQNIISSVDPIRLAANALPEIGQRAIAGTFNQVTGPLIQMGQIGQRILTMPPQVFTQTANSFVSGPNGFLSSGIGREFSIAQSNVLSTFDSFRNNPAVSSVNMETTFGAYTSTVGGANFTAITDTSLINKLIEARKRGYINEVGKPDENDEANSRLFVIAPRYAAVDQRLRGTRARLRLKTDRTTKEIVNSSQLAAKNRKELEKSVDNLLSDGGFLDFLLMDLNASFNEKVQVTQVFGDSNVAYFFGQQPVFFAISGLLIDDVYNKWFTNFVDAYSHVLRGTKLAQNYELIELRLPNATVIGSIVGMSYSQNSSRDTDIPFTMQILVKSYETIPAEIPKNAPAKDILSLSVPKNFRTQADIRAILRSPAASRTSADNPAGLSNMLSGPLSGVGGIFSSVTSTIDAVRSSIFSPISGVITQISRIVNTVSGNVSGVINSFTFPIRNVLRSVTSIAGQATALVTLVENSINRFASQIGAVVTDYRQMVNAVKSTAGTISRVPETVSSSVKRLVSTGNMSSGAAFLNGGRSGRASSSALLRSNTRYTPQRGARL